MKKCSPHVVLNPHKCLRLLAPLALLIWAATLWAGEILDDAPRLPQHPNTAIGYPVFKGDAHPIPQAGVAFAPGGYLAKIFAADQAHGAGSTPGNDFWIDRMLVRTGDGGGFGDTNNWLFTRGRAAYMYTHKPEELGFVGEAAYWHKTGHDALFGCRQNRAVSCWR